RKYAVVMHAVVSIKKQNWPYGHLGFYRYPKCTIIKIFQRVWCHVKCPLGKNNYRNPFLQNRFHVSYAFRPVLSAATINSHNSIFINKPEYRHCSHFRFAQCPYWPPDGFYNDRGIEIRNMIGHKNELFALIQWLLEIILMKNENEKEPNISPQHAKPVDHIATCYTAK